MESVQARPLRPCARAVTQRSRKDPPAVGDELLCDRGGSAVAHAEHYDVAASLGAHLASMYSGQRAFLANLVSRPVHDLLNCLRSVHWNPHCCLQPCFGELHLGQRATVATSDTLETTVMYCNLQEATGRFGSLFPRRLNQTP